MDKEIRNRIKKMVKDARTILQTEIEELLEGVFGLHNDGTIEDISRLPAIREDANAIKAREGFAYFIEREAAADNTKPDAVKKLVLGLTFTHLNRLVALKLMERRNVIRETVSRITKSNGFIHYVVDVLKKTDLSQIEDVDEAYKGFIIYQCQQVAEEIKVLFDPEDLSSYVFPRPRALKAMLDVINNDDLNEIWEEDETIGWFYQYFTPKEMREQARAESKAPRNSWELAFRNQFYTPRYVVRFLADNTLGRTWYEMRQGDTELKDFCEYMVIPQNEVFLEKDKKPSDDKDTYQIPFREKKDPRELKILDPACGSGHFLLYVFDLLVCIYNEAYTDPDLGPKLSEAYPNRDEFEKEIPRLILENNLYGIDIDLRAIQIAALALWLRTQREWNEMNISRNERPKITKAHFICAEPMPGNQDLFDEFVVTLKPALLSDLTRDVWEKMRLAGEAGSLLQIDKELRQSIKKAREAWLKLPKETQLTLFGHPEAQQMDLSLREIKDETFFRDAEERVLDALRGFAEKAITDNHGYSRKLFAEESIKGFRFVEILQNRFDIVLMNPPFGETSPSTKMIFQRLYPEWNRNLLCAFIHRMLDLLTKDGSLGVIFDRTAVVKSSYRKFRQEILISRNTIFTVADTGWDVLDANVETIAMALHKNVASIQHHPAFFFDVRSTDSQDKQEQLLSKTKTLSYKERTPGVYVAVPLEFMMLPNSVIGYDMQHFVRSAFARYKPVKEALFKAVQGLVVPKDEFVRFFWEANFRDIGVSNKWCLFYNGGPFSYYFMPCQQVVFWNTEGKRIKIHRNSRPQNIPYYFREGICYGKRGEFIDAHAFPGNRIFSNEGMACFLVDNGDRWFALSILNNSLSQYTINTYCGLHKDVGYVNILPVPPSPPANLKNALSTLLYCV